MGYYTDYELEIINDVDEDKFNKDFIKITGYDIEELYGIKWYDSDKNMLELSKLYPNNLFTLYGSGEESEDKWVSYYHNGNSYGGQAKIIYPKPDFSKLDNFDQKFPELFI